MSRQRNPADDYLKINKLNGRSDFIGRLHAKLSWGWPIYTKEGMDVVTLSNAQERSFDLRVGDWVVVWNNRLWFPYAAYKEVGVSTSFAKFKVGEHIHSMLSVDDPKTKEHLFTTVSAVWAHSLVESNIRPVSSDKQRKAFARWIGDNPIRARMPLTALTACKTDIIDNFINHYNEHTNERYVVTGYSSLGDFEIQVRLAFAHLRTNTVLRYLWNKHRYCGLQYKPLYRSIGALYSDSLCIVSVPRVSREATQAEDFFASVFPEDVLGIKINKPLHVCIRTGCISELSGTVI